jgi:glycosyltransferase involved in cell wall biosynthesis
VKILIVSDYAMEGYGSELQMLALRDGLRQRGHDVRVFSSNARLVQQGEIMADYQCPGTLSRFLTLLQTANPWAYWKLRKVLREFRPDVVHVKIFLTQLSPLILPLLKNIPSLYQVDILRPVCPMNTKVLPDGTLCGFRAGTACYHAGCLPMRSLLPQMLELWLWRRWRGSFDRIIAVSHAVCRYLVTDGIEPVDVIWDPVSSRPARPPISSPPVVAFAGRLAREKGVEILLKAFARVLVHIPKARLILAGEGKQEGYLRKLVTDMGISSNVTMTGYLHRREMEHIFDAAWVQVVPSIWVEAQGGVSTEAMMRGTAVIASNIGGLAEMVLHGETGLLVPPNDVEALAKALKQILQNRDLAEQMGKAGRKYALEHFDRQKHLDKMLLLYKTMVSNKLKTNE